MAYLTGQRDFWSLQLSVNEHTLIPRPETETLVEWALELPVPGAALVADLGTGSGAIALALASERPALASDGRGRSAEALEVARANARTADLAQVRFQQSDWYQALSGAHFHLLLSNPPYVDGRTPTCSRVMCALNRAVHWWPGKMAWPISLNLVDGAPRHLLSGGWLLLEHGFKQGAAVRRLLLEAGFDAVSTREDLAGLERITGGCWRAN